MPQLKEGLEGGQLLLGSLFPQRKRARKMDGWEPCFPSQSVVLTQFVSRHLPCPSSLLRLPSIKIRPLWDGG